jgi:hypothetical protein
MLPSSGKLGNGRVSVDTFGATLDRKTAGVELIVRCVQFRSALTTNDTGFGSTKHELGLIVVFTQICETFIQFDICLTMHH